MVFFISLKTARSIGDTIRSGKQEYRENTVLQDKVVLFIMIMDSYWIYECTIYICLLETFDKLTTENTLSLFKSKSECFGWVFACCKE